MTVDGFGFGTLTGESCLKNVHCHTDRASWDAILVTVVAFGALMWKTCAQSHRFGLGRVGGGGYHGGGSGVGMAWDVHAGSQYGFVWAWHAGSQTQANMVDVINYLRHAPELRLPRCWPEDW